MLAGQRGPHLGAVGHLQLRLRVYTVPHIPGGCIKPAVEQHQQDAPSQHGSMCQPVPHVLCWPSCRCLRLKLAHQCDTSVPAAARMGSVRAPGKSLSSLVTSYTAPNKDTQQSVGVL